MLEALAAWVLNTYVGEYVENLNTDQLSIALLQGAVELDNLPLKKDALKSLGLPLVVKSGFIGKITLQIPLRRLQSEPWVISMERLYLVAGPVKETQYNDEKERAAHQSRKEAMLADMESKWQKQKIEKQEWSWFSYGASVATNILENLQLKIKDVHIRYEDDQVNPACPVSFGVVINELSAQSTDGSWKPKFVSGDSVEMMHKLVDLRNFAMYFDTNTTMVGDLPQADMANAMQREMYVSSITQQFKDHEYILSPITAQAKMKRNTSAQPLRSPATPRIAMDLALEKMAFTLTDDQYKCMVMLLKDLDRKEKQQRHRHLRPLCSVRGNAKVWWRFAIQAKLNQIHEQNQRHTWTYVLTRAGDIVLYYKTYRRHLLNEALDTNNKNHKAKMEEELTFEELKILRELAYNCLKREGKLEKHLSPTPAESSSEKPADGQDKGVLQRWFPGWGGWYGAQPSKSDSGTDVDQAGNKSKEVDTTVGEPPPAKISKTELEQELTDVIEDVMGEDDQSVLKRDTVFATLNFCLDSGSFKLLGTKPSSPQGDPQTFSVLELECSVISMLFESRPRSRGMKFGISVEGLELLDKITENTNFPVLVGSQNKEKFGPSRFSSASGTVKMGKTLPVIADEAGEGKLFELLYEKNPAGTTAHYRFKMKTKPLDMVYNRTAINKVRDFFSSSRWHSTRRSELNLTAVARRRYESLKRQTQAELKHTLEQLLEGTGGVQVKRWEVNLDISAPQIIIPESFTEANASMVILDLGNIRFQNETPLSSHTSSQTFNDDDFHTPMSTPPSEPMEVDPDVMGLSDLSKMELTESQFYNKLYDKYTLDLAHLQVMVGRMKDNWRAVHHRGSSPLHLVDRFSITLQLERRLIYTTDPQWPSVTVSGTLPHLTIHVNEHKVQTLNTCIQTTSQSSSVPQHQTPTPSVTSSSLGESASALSLEELMETSAQNVSSVEERMEDKMKDVLVDSQLLLMQFSINHVSLEIHSRDRALAELQVAGVKTNLTKRPFDTSVTLTVHSLLVVDALQSYGSDFELLVASHRNLTLDSTSGSIRDSGPTSPTSPCSPPSSPVESLPNTQQQQGGLQSVQEAVTRAFNALMTGTQSVTSPPSERRYSGRVTSPVPDSEALITLEFEIISAKSPSNNGDGPLNIANFQFNNLDVIANQETLVELLSFMKRTIPSSRKLKSSRPADSNLTRISGNADKSFNQPTQLQKPKLEVTADFNRLSLLLMRLDASSGSKMAKKVATVTMSCARVHATLDSELSLSGSLGGFHVLDIKPDVQRHQRVFSMGHDASHSDFPRHIFSDKDMYRTANESLLLDECSQDSRAFSFKLTKPRRYSVYDRSRSQLSVNDSEFWDKGDNCCNVTVRMSSLCYTHSPRTLHELSQCMSEFKDYMTSVATSIKNAATEVAKGMVTKRSDTLNTSLYGSNHSLNMYTANLSRQNQTLDQTEAEFLETTAALEEAEGKQKSRIVLDASLETPVIVIPQSATSSRVFVAHLGHISVSNKDGSDSMKEASAEGERTERIFMEMKNMNLHSMDLDEMSGNASAMDLDASVNDLYFNTRNGTPIMHNTTVQVTIDHIVPDASVINSDISHDVSFEPFPSKPETDSVKIQDEQPMLDFHARIQTPVKMVLSKHVYEQILKTTDNLSYVDIDAERTSGLDQSDTVTSLDDSSSTIKDESNISTGSRQSSFSQQKSSVFLSKKLKLEVPKFSVELRGDFGEGEQGLVELSLYNFLLDYIKDNTATSNVHLFLKSLVMDDLLEAPDSPHRQIMVSKAPQKEDERSSKPKEFLSSSCPDNAIQTPVPVMPPSLPSSFHEAVSPGHYIPATLIGQFASTGRGKQPRGGTEIPCTPPPSPWMSRSMSVEELADEHLVHISLILVDKNSPEYTDKYNKTKRFVDVDFSCLDTKINLQTWVVLLDFLGLGAKVHDVKDMEQPERVVNRAVSRDGDETQVVNSEIKLKVENLSIILNKPEYQFAQASISKLSSDVSLRDGNFTMKGQLGQMSLLDLSPNGQLYRERFITVGQHAMEFDIFKYGIPDPWLRRDFDMRLKLRMASVRYVHTNRFQAEMLGFVQHFLQLQDVLGRMRAASAGKEINETAFHSPRLLLDIEAGSPIILIPHSSRTTDVLVADLGTLSVKNCFKFDGDPGTFSHTESDKANNGAASTGQSAEQETSKNAVFRSVSQSSTSSQQIPNALTESLFEELQPPRTNIDPMTESIYGGLEMDLRSETSDVILGSSQEIFDPTDVPQSPTTDGSSVDPIISMSLNLNESQSDSVLGSLSHSVHPTHSTPDQTASCGQRSMSDSSVLGQRSVFACSRVSLDGEGKKKHLCLLDMMDITLSDMDLYAAERKEKKDYKGNNLRRDLEFPSCIMQRQGWKLLKDKCVLNLKVERNLEGEISHAAPDWRVRGAFSSVHCCIDINQYKLIRGVLEHNLGEKMEVFKKELMSHMQDPKIQTVLTGDVWTMISISLDLTNVTVELLTSHQQGRQCPENSLAKLDFIRSQLCYDSFSDQSKEVDLVSHEIQASDTRFRDVAVNLRPSVFEKILQPCSNASPDSLQMELHYRATPHGTRFKILLNNMKLMCVFDWLLSVHEFLMTKAENPFLADEVEQDNETFQRQTSDTSMSAGESGSRTSSPLSTSGGIITKRGPHVEQTEVPFELKLNVTETQFVVLENMASWDTSAVVLKCTALMSYRPKAQDKLMSCTLQSLEVFSCCLQAEDDTAMSIVDPMTISVELNANPLPDARPTVSVGLQEAKIVDERQLLLEVNFGVMNIRLSYLDLKMFLAIMNSLPDQALNAKHSKARTSPQSVFSESQLTTLQGMGFSRDDCEKALTKTEGRTNEAAMWLTENAVIHTPKKDEMKITSVEMKSSCVCVCLIDDCLDADVPLAELSFNGVNFNLKLWPSIEGKANFQLVADYYNRTLSGWEPVIEPWRCHADWKRYEEMAEKLALQLTAPDVLNINLTRTLIEQYNKTKVKWTEDYYKQDMETSPVDTMSSSAVRRRQPFTPYVIRNLTGSPLWFLTVTMSPSSVGTGGARFQGQKMDDAYIQATEWKNVPPSEDMPFFFYRREKIRHKKSHSLQVNQLVVKVEGWQRLSPVSVDKVGVYFRKAYPDRSKSIIQVNDRQATRVVFDVRQEGSARKVITLRSALLILNRLDGPVEVKMDSPIIPGRHEYMLVDSGQQKPVPMSFIHSALSVRPVSWGVNFCEPLDWHYVQRPGETVDIVRLCQQDRKDMADVYRICVAVRRELYPEETVQEGTLPLPGHKLTIMPPVTVVNRLPVDLQFYMKGTNICGSIKAGKEAQLHAADLNDDLQLGIHLENFPHCRELIIPPGTQDYRVKLRLYDNIDRPLELNVHIQTRTGGSVRLSVSCHYWLVNKSGLPLIFRQDYAKEAAGQFEEHELARSVTPLLFSFTDKELAYQCSMRIGRSVHGTQGTPHWCNSFTLDSGVGRRQLHVSARSDNRPDWLVDLQWQVRKRLLMTSQLVQVYNIGIEVRQGKGQLRDTNIVTFAPRYEIDNQSGHKLAIAQRHFTNKEAILNPDGHLTALPKCKLPFHWPRLDLDQLLCVRMMDVKTCNWSGGFKIDKISSFHVNMRDDRRNSILLKVEVILQGPTYHVIFTDAEEMPPPFRIDNLSEVTLLYYQTKAPDDRLRTTIKPHTSLPYAWDEPTLDPYITLSVPNGTSATYSLNKLGEGEQLCYQNFIYISATATFPKAGGQYSHLQHRELVLDCQHDNHVVFKKKEAGKRSQLWRMTGDGMLEHEGLMPPRDPRKPSSGSVDRLVLDIADIALQPGKPVPLMLKKVDERRRAKQSWKFTETGMLCSCTGHLCVQAVSGVEGLQDGAIAVLGPGPGECLPVPYHMSVSRQKLHPGSGCLSVRVHMDGPIRVLQITDIQQRRVVRVSSQEAEDWEVYEETLEHTTNQKHRRTTHTNIELSVNLKGGIGLSLVNTVPEELMYIALKNISLYYIANPKAITMEISVASIQADNQLFGTQRPIMLFVTPTSKRDVPDNTPALHVAVHKIPNNNWNAEIYKHLIISMKKLTIQLEERLLWKLIQFFGYHQAETGLEEHNMDLKKTLEAATSEKVKRYYFGMLKVKTSCVTLSMLTASRLSPELKAVKSSMSIPLIRFEDAKVDLDPFIRYHPFETRTFIVREVMNHYTEELKSQAAKILGSVDFLGNPLGLFNDVTEGISGLIKDGNLGGLVKNVVHGISNSTAKVTGAMSDGLGKLNDSRHNDMREQIKTRHGESSGGHLVAGIKGLGHGIWGGAVSVVTQPYDGAKEAGLGGFLVGLTKGVVGMVSRPATGVLDLATGAANAIKDGSQRSSHVLPNRAREPRCCYGPGGLLPPYSKQNAETQDLLYRLNDQKYDEFLIALEQLRFGAKDCLRALITSKQVYFLRRLDPHPENVILKVTHSDLYQCKNIENDGRYYIELVLKGDPSGSIPNSNLKRPQVRCDKQTIAQKVAQQVNYAKNLFDEQKHTLAVDRSADDSLD